MEQALKRVKIAQLIKLILRYGILFLILFFLIAHIAKNWNRLDEFTYEVHWTYLGLSILSLLASMLLLPLALRNIVRLLKYEISLKRMCMILFYSQIAKYLPGGIWSYVGRVYLYKREGMNGSDAFACVFLETILILISGIIVFCISLFFGGEILSVEWMPREYFSEIVIAAMVILLFVVHPKVLSLLWRLIPARFIDEKLQLEYSYSSVLRPVLLLITFWLGVGGGFWLLVSGFYHMHAHLLPMAAGTFVLAWIVGFLAFFLPGGLGVREAVLVLSLNLYLPISISSLSAVAARLWWVTGELSWTLLSLVWNGFESIRRVQNGGNSPGALKR
jgi:uncharacterized membrane protein YbhN (UPF0104 family)